MMKRKDTNDFKDKLMAKSVQASHLFWSCGGDTESHHTSPDMTSLTYSIVVKRF